MSLDRAQYIGYGLNLRQLQVVVSTISTHPTVYAESLDDMIKKHRYTDYIDDFNREPIARHLPTISYAREQPIVYFNNAELGNFANIHNVIPMLINCIAEITWMDYTNRNKNDANLIDEDVFFKTMKEILNNRQCSLFRRIRK